MRFFRLTTLIVLLTMVLQTWGISVTYIDSSGSSQTAAATEITSTTHTLSAGYWCVSNDVTITEAVTLVGGTVNIILMDGKTLTASKGIKMNTDAYLFIYGQSSQSGKLVVSNDGGTTSDYGLHVTNYTQYGGIVNASSTGANGLYTEGYLTMGRGLLSVSRTGSSEPYDPCIYATGNVTVSGGSILVGGSNVEQGLYSRGMLTISGGSLIVDGNYRQKAIQIKDNITMSSGVLRANNGNSISPKGISTEGTITFEWNSNSDYVYCNDFTATSISSSKAFYADNTQIASTTIDASTIAGKALTPQKHLTLTEANGVTVLNTNTWKNINISLDFTRSGLTAGAYSTVCLPFSFTKPGGCSFYTIASLSYDNTLSKWVCNVTPVTGNTLSAATPYIFTTTQTSETFRGSIENATADYSDTNAKTQVGKWTFQGMYADCSLPKSGEYNYGFAGEAKDDISIGTFMRFIGNSKGKTFRCYLKYDPTASARPYTLRAASADEIPDEIIVRIVEPESETTGIQHTTTMQKKTDKWYTLDGRQLEGEPTQHGLYINNGKKYIKQ